MDSQIGQRGLRLPSDVDSAFADGLYLIPLAEVVTEDKAMRHQKKPKFRIHKIENCTIGLKLLTEHGFVPDISPENFVDSGEAGKKGSAGPSRGKKGGDGVSALCLGFIWQLFCFAQYRGKDGGSGGSSDDLLEWVQGRVKDNERYPGVPVENFTTHWQDGKLIAALLDSLSPKILDYENAQLENPVGLWTSSLDAAEDWLDVPQLLEPEDMVDEKPDDKSVRMQVELIRQAYLALQDDIESGALFPEDEIPAPAPVVVEADAPEAAAPAPAPRPRRKRKDPRDDISREELIDKLVDMYTHINNDCLACPECQADLTDWAEEHNARVPPLP